MNNEPEVSYRKYRLEIEVPHQYDLPPYNIKKGDKYWQPIGCDEGTIDKAKRWLRVKLNVWDEYQNPRYRIQETIHWRPSTTTVEEGSRERGLSEL